MARARDEKNQSSSWGTLLKDDQGSLAQLKHRTYVVLLIVGLAGSVSALLINELTGTISPFTRGVFVITITFLALQVWLVKGKRLPPEVIEESLYVFVSAIVLCVLFYALYLSPSLALARESLFSLYIWFPLFYAFIFLVYESPGALVRSGLLYLLVVSFSLPHALTTLGSPDPFDGFNTLGQFYIAIPSFAAVLYLLTKLKDQLRKTQDVAEQMAALARTDALTGIPNRRQIEDVLEQEMERSRRYETPLSFIVFDLDDFKCLNDTYGHDAGDGVLVQLAELIQPHLRPSDWFGRWGGEEFVIVASSTPLRSAQRLANRLRSAIVDHELGPERTLSASFGVSEFRPDDSATTLVKRADVALYRAKEHGKNRVEV
jgi:diguanylate cyclase (GGDEF)-like protein